MKKIIIIVTLIVLIIGKYGNIYSQPVHNCQVLQNYKILNSELDTILRQAVHLVETSDIVKKQLCGVVEFYESDCCLGINIEFHNENYYYCDYDSSDIWGFVSYNDFPIFLISKKNTNIQADINKIVKPNVISQKFKIRRKGIGSVGEIFMDICKEKINIYHYFILRSEPEIKNIKSEKNSRAK